MSSKRRKLRYNTLTDDTWYEERLLEVVKELLAFSPECENEVSLRAVANRLESAHAIDITNADERNYMKRALQSAFENRILERVSGTVSSAFKGTVRLLQRKKRKKAKSTESVRSKRNSVVSLNNNNDSDREDETLAIKLAYFPGTKKRIVLPKYTEENATRCTLRVCGHTLTLHDLKTVQLKGTFDREELKAMRKAYSGWMQRKSWMNDNAIHCFLEAIADEHTKVIGSIEANLIFSGVSTGRLFHSRKGNLNESWISCSKILLPYCVDDCHWALIYVNVAHKKIYCFDPSGKWKVSTSQWRNLQTKLNTLDGNDDTEWILRKRDIYKQDDDYSCGPFICSYAESLLRGTSLTTRIDPAAYRNYILETLIKAADKLK